MSWVRYRGAIGSGLLLGAVIGGCTLDTPDYLEPPTEEEEVPENPDTTTRPNRPSRPQRADAGPMVEADAGLGPDDGPPDVLNGPAFTIVQSLKVM